MHCLIIIINLSPYYYRLFEKSDNFVPEINSVLSDMLTNCQTQVYVLVGHSSHIPFASSCLSKCLIPFSVMGPIEDLSHTSSSVHIVEIDKEHSEVVQDLIQKHPNGSLMHVVHSSLTALKKLKETLFSDDSPRLYNGFGSCVMTEGTTESRVKLCLPQWADSVSYKQFNDAEMDPWLNVITEDELSELLSARIISVGGS